MTLGPPIGRLTFGFSDVFLNVSFIKVRLMAHFVVNPQHLRSMLIRFVVWSDFSLGTSSNMGQHPYVWTLTLQIVCFPRVCQSTFMDNFHLAMYRTAISCLEDSHSCHAAISLRMSYLLQIGIQPSSLHLLRCSHGRWGLFERSNAPWHGYHFDFFPKGTSQKGGGQDLLAVVPSGCESERGIQSRGMQCTNHSTLFKIHVYMQSRCCDEVHG